MPPLNGKQIRDASVENVKLIRPGTRVRAKSVGPITLSGPGTTIDGVTLSVGDRVLLGDQTAGVENGVYIFQGAASTMTRAADYLIGATVAGSIVAVSEGTVNDNTLHLCTNNEGSDVVNTDILAFSDITGTGVITGGPGIDFTADKISVDLSAVSGLLLTGGDSGTLEVEPDVTTGANIQPVNLTSDGVGLDVNAIAGVGIDADGAAALEIAAQGDGITGGGGTVLAVQAEDDTIQVGVGGVKSIKAQKGDKDETPSPTSGNDADSGVTVLTTPVGDRYIQVFVNGLKVGVGDADKTNFDSFFSDTASTPFTALALSAITAGSKLIWNGVVAGYDLDATDRIDLDYEIAA